MLLAHWYWLVAAGILCAIATYLLVWLYVPKTYRAEAEIKPVSRKGVSGSLMGGLMSGLGISNPGIGIENGLGFTEHSAEEMIAIMESYDFIHGVVAKYHLDNEIADKSAKPLSPWLQYRKMLKQTKCEYNFRNGLITIYFDAHNPAQARQILGYYLEALRNQLRRDEIESASAAIAALQAEVEKISDSMLREQLYDLLAKQIQRQRLAEIQTDFWFGVIQTPVVPDKPVKPTKLIDAMIAAVLGFAAAVVVVGAAHGRSHAARARPGTAVRIRSRTARIKTVPRKLGPPTDMHGATRL